MALYEVLARFRQYPRFKENILKEVEKEIALLTQSLPFTGRISIKGKIYAGRVNLLNLEKEGKRLEFEIEDIVPEGEEKGKIYHKHVAVEEVIDILKF